MFKKTKHKTGKIQVGMFFINIIHTIVLFIDIINIIVLFYGRPLEELLI